MNPLPKSPNQQNEKTPETQKPPDKYLQFAKEKLTPKEFALFMQLRQKGENLSEKERYNYKKLRIKIETHAALTKLKTEIEHQVKQQRKEILQKPEDYVPSAEKILNGKFIRSMLMYYEPNLFNKSTQFLTGKSATKILSEYVLGLDKDKKPTREQVENTKRILTTVEKEIIDLTNDL